MSSGEVRKVSPEDIEIVQNLIERCISFYLTPKQVVDILHQEQKIDPTITKLIWQKLVEQNQEFFEGYHLRLILKEQMIEYNNLLDKQAALMSHVGPNGSHMLTLHQNTSCYMPENTGIVMKKTSLPSGFTNCGPLIHSGMQPGVDMSAHSQRIDVPLNMCIAQNSNLGMNGLSIKTKPGYLDSSRFLDDTASFEPFGLISQSIGFPDLAADFTNGENKRLGAISENLDFQDFGRHL